MSGELMLHAFDIMVQARLRALNEALRSAAEQDLVIDVVVERQDLQDDVNVRRGAATYVRVTLRRHEGPGVGPAE
jgi:hypothetical protein